MKSLTRKQLIEWGVTNVDPETGDVFVNDKYKKPVRLVGKHKYGADRVYLGINFINYDTKVDIIQKYRKKDGTIREYNSWSYKSSIIPVARVVLAWVDGSIDSNMDADHIDGNPMNNSYSNLQAITRKENLAKRMSSQQEIANRWHEIKGDKR